MRSANRKKSIVEILAEFITTQNFQALPKEAPEQAKGYLLDIMGCIIGGSKEPQAKALIEVVKAEGCKPQGTVFMNGLKTSVMYAALINGTMGHALELDDSHREAVMHPSAVVFPAVFALGEKLGVSGKELILAYVLGLEVMIRVGESFLGKSTYQGFHPTGTCGVFGAAAGCAALLRLNSRQTKYALGLAGSFAAGTLECTGEGSWQKPLQAGHPAMCGVLAASLADQNFVGSGTVLDGPGGLIKAFSFKDIYDYGRITETLGKKWEMMDTSIKVHACCRFSAPEVDCALDLYRRGVRAKDVKEILAKVCDYTIKVLCNPTESKVRPVTRVDAQFSLPYAIAVAICRNRAGAAEFRREALNDPEVLRLAEKVRWELDPGAESMYPKAYPATLVAILNDGQQLESHVDYPKGDPENPASMEEIIDKFNSVTGAILSQTEREEIIEQVGRLEEIGNISDIADSLR
jgi:2-methylcitrate dehydratase PrpD